MENLNELFIDLMKGALPDAVISNFILIAEVVTEDGKAITVAHSVEMTPWLATGMVEFASEAMFDNRHSED